MPKVTVKDTRRFKSEGICSQDCPYYLKPGICDYYNQALVQDANGAHRCHECVVEKPVPLPAGKYTVELVDSKIRKVRNKPLLRVKQIHKVVKPKRFAGHIMEIVTVVSQRVEVKSMSYDEFQRIYFPKAWARVLKRMKEESKKKTRKVKR